MADLVLVKRDMLKYEYDFKVVRGLGWDITDHSVVLRQVGGDLDKMTK